MTGDAESRVRHLERTTDIIYIFEIDDKAATIYTLQRQILGAKLVIFIDGNAASAALLEEAAKIEPTWVSVHGS